MLAFLCVDIQDFALAACHEEPMPNGSNYHLFLKQKIQKERIVSGFKPSLANSDDLPVNWQPNEVTHEASDTIMAGTGYLGCGDVAADRVLQSCTLLDGIGDNKGTR